MLLATDLDGTFLGGRSLHRQQLYRLIKNNQYVQLVYVTSRALESVIPLLNDPILPNPHFIICDVGSTIVNGSTLEPIEPFQSEMEKKWPGVLKILESVKGVPGLQYQEVPQRRCCSFFTDDLEIVDIVRKRINKLDCDVIYSANGFLDVVPIGVNKGTTLQNLIYFLGIDNDNVLVAGDTLNDLGMLLSGFPAVAVGNSESELLEATLDTKQVYQASAIGAGGILESMDHFEQFRYLITKAELPFQIEDSNTQQLVMMYHRFPHEKREKEGKAEYISPQSSNGILPTLQSLFANGRSGLWIAWEEVNKSGDILRNIFIDQEKYPHLVASRIGLTRIEIEIFYKSFSKEAFWPTIFSFIDKASFNHRHWEHFVRINKMFAERASEQCDPGAMVWIHDYNLWLVPGFLRQTRPDLKIGFFHHTAFPAASTFNILPWRREIISSLLQCDYIGFHIPRYVENFMDVVRSLFPVKVLVEIDSAPRFLTYSTALGVDKTAGLIDTSRRTVGLGAHPVGIDLNHISRILNEEKTMSGISTLRCQFGNKKLVLSVERLDYVKGPLEKVLAFEQFLDEHREYHGKIELLNICTAPAQDMKIYDRLQHDLEHAIGRINGKYSKVDWTPVRFFFRPLPFREVIMHYAAADIAWITPVRDGLNLVAKEFIAVQGQRLTSKGVLILSEFAGAAVELPDAVLTNPYDRKSLKEGLEQALSFSEEEREMRMKRLYDQVSYYDIEYWATDFIKQLSSQKRQSRSEIFQEQ